MYRLEPRQIVHAVLILVLYAPVVLSVGWTTAARAWSGVWFLIFIVALMSVFVALAWWFASQAFGGEDEAGGDAP